MYYDFRRPFYGKCIQYCLTKALVPCKGKTWPSLTKRRQSAPPPPPPPPPASPAPPRRAPGRACPSWKAPILPPARQPWRAPSRGLSARTGLCRSPPHALNMPQLMIDFFLSLCKTCYSKFICIRDVTAGVSKSHHWDISTHITLPF